MCGPLNLVLYILKPFNLDCQEMYPGTHSMEYTNKHNPFLLPLTCFLTDFTYSVFIANTFVPITSFDQHPNTHLWSEVVVSTMHPSTDARSIPVTRTLPGPLLVIFDNIESLSVIGVFSCCHADRRSRDTNNFTQAVSMVSAFWWLISPGTKARPKHSVVV